MADMKRDIIANTTEAALAQASDIYKSRFIGMEDLKDAGFNERKPMKATIVKFILEGLKDNMVRGSKIPGGVKGILILDRPAGKKNEVLLNKTSFRLLKHAWKLDAAAWNGGTVSIYAGKPAGKDGVMVEPVKPGGGATLPQASEAPPGDLDFPEEEIPHDER